MVAKEEEGKRLKFNAHTIEQTTLEDALRIKF